MIKLKSNLLIHFFINEWKSFVRGTDIIQKTTENIIAYIFYIILICTCSIFGVELKYFLKQIWPNNDYLNSFYLILIFYWFFDMFLRHLLQKIPTIDLNAYLILNINKKIVKLYFILRTFFTFYSILPLCIFLPIIYNNISSDYNHIVTIKVILMIFSICIGNHFAIIYLKKQSLTNEGMFLVPLLSFISIWLLNRKHLIQFTAIDLINKSSSTNLNSLVILFLCWLFLTLIFFIKDFKNNFYFDNTNINNKHGILINKKIFQGKNNIINKLVETELKLLLRNKRSRSLLYTLIFSLVYGFIIFRSEIQESSNIIFVEITGIIVSGIVVNSYAQYILAWQSDHFEYILTSNIKLKEIIWSKFYVCDIINILSFIILSPFILKYNTLVPILISAQLYNIGVQPILAMFFACINSKYLNINHFNNFNYQGIGIEQFIYVLTNIILAILIYLPFTLISNSWISVIVIGLIGITNIILRKFWITILANKLKHNKYHILNGFRIK